MDFFPIDIKGTEFKVVVADTDSARAKGLSGYKRLGKHKGMLFIFPEKARYRMVMRDMNFDLDFVFLSSDWSVTQLGSLRKDDVNGIVSDIETNMILELPAGTIEKTGLRLGDKLKPDEELNVHFQGVKRFKSGGRFELIGEKIYKIKIDDVKPEEGKLQILNEIGEVVANIESGSRIFSRTHTKELIEKFKKGDGKGLVDSMLNILDIQDNQEPDYVKT